MKTALLVLVLLPALVLAQGKVPTSSAGGITRVASLGACNTAADGRVVWLTTANAIYACDGVAWHWVWTEREGSLPNADAIVPARTMVLHAPSGAYALLVENNARVDFGAGPSDEVVSNGVSVLASSWVFNDVSTDVMANRTVNGSLFVSVARNLVLLGSANSPASHCASGSDAGGLKHYSSDGRLYYCDGTTSLPVGRILFNTATVDFGSIANHATGTATMTLTGAETTDVVTCSPLAAPEAGLGFNVFRVSASNTVEISASNHSGGNLDPAPLSMKCTVIR